MYNRIEELYGLYIVASIYIYIVTSYLSLLYRSDVISVSSFGFFVGLVYIDE